MPASVFAVCGAPTIVGGVLADGAPLGYFGIATSAGSEPWNRSPSLQCGKPGTEAQPAAAGPAGRAKWSAPKRNPRVFAARLRGYVTSEIAVPSVAFAYANR